MRLLTFNVLAPCYRRIVKAGGRGVTRESTSPTLYRKRTQELLQLLEAAGADVVCLQEFWFHEEFAAAFEGALGARFDFVGLQRPGYKGDGVMILVNRARFVVTAQHPLIFEDEGERVALFVTLQRKDEASTVLVGTTHLTFPHTIHDVRLAGQQTQKLLQFADALQASQPAPVILAGDFNSEPDSKVYEAILQRRFIDTWQMCHKHRPVSIHTHHNHRGQKLCVDYIFLRNSPACAQASPGLSALQAQLLPLHLRPEKWPEPEEYDVSDHRPLLTAFTPTPAPPLAGA